MKQWPLGNYGLGWVLLTLFFVSWILQGWTGRREFQADQREHNQPAHVFGQDGYVWNWAEATFENWQSEFLQLFTMVTLTSILIVKGSTESKDSDDEMKAMLLRIERRLDDLTLGTVERGRETHVAYGRDQAGAGSD